MTVLDRVVRPAPAFVDKGWLRKMLAEHDAATGFARSPDMTPEKAQEIVASEMRALGISQEDGIFSHGIIAMREE